MLRSSDGSLGTVSDVPVEARGLVKRYGEIAAVGGVDLTVRRGEIYGFLGPNGAGKTTTLRILLGLIRPNAGNVRLFGRDPQTDLPQALDGVAGFVETPLLLLDEPTNGLDPGGIRDMRVLIGRLAKQGITILLSSHLLAEVEELCHRVAIIRDGRIVYEGSIDELLARRTANRYRLRTSDIERARMIALNTPGVSDVSVDRAELVFVADESTVEELSRALVDAGLGLRALIPETASLEALFFELTEGEPSPVTAEASP